MCFMTATTHPKNIALTTLRKKRKCDGIYIDELPAGRISYLNKHETDLKILS